MKSEREFVADSDDVRNAAQGEGRRAFDWRNCWYPVSFLEDLPKDRPTGFTLYDEPLVLFFAGDDSLVCLRDKCVHRSARLSDGQIIDGRLECGYHGWQYDSAGKCVHIPQLSERIAIPGKACVRKFPLEIVQGLVWIWSGDPNRADSNLIPTTDVIDDSNITLVDFQMDLPYDQSYLIENVIDVAHIHIAHHGVRGGGDRAAAKPIKFKIESSTKAGFRSELGSIENAAAADNSVLKAAILEFVAPNLVRYTSEYRNETLQSGLSLYSLPLGKSRCRLLYRKYANFTSWQERWKPRWLEHWTQCLILEQDMGVVIGQYEEIERAEDGLNSQWFPIKTSDRLVLEFRKWLDTYGANLPFYRGFTTSKPCRDDPFVKTSPTDRFSLHTMVCATCSRWHRNLGIAIQGFLVVAAVLGILAVATSGSVLSIVSISVAGALLAAVVGIRWMRRRFE